MKSLIRTIRYTLYNKRNQTRIGSEYANLNAIYGIDVGVGKGTYIESNVKIGDYSYINTNSYVENCEIGKFCSISSGVFISPFEHPLNYRTTHPFTYNKSYGFVQENNNLERKKVYIGNDVLISLNVVIKEGITIGNGAVVGAGSIVTKDVKPYEIVGGVPAKHIKYRFCPEEIENLEKVKFWDWNKEKIINNIDYLRNSNNSIT
ncbi:CatB-related O-acetyltransferase [Heyndrickxia sp. MSNUG]|uniref:CatB-related O-acetyltransferase n=1 Tax=Heyndrickxia sp. MSNUG TaxID=3136677 RepID=UPI003C2DE944